MELCASVIRSDDNENELGWKDYLAFIIAAFETILVPLIVLVVVLIVLLFIFRGL